MGALGRAAAAASSWARALLWTARIELSGAVRYRAAFVSDIAVYSAVLAFLMLSGSGRSLAERYGTADYRSLMFAGYIAWTFANAALVSGVNNTASELSRGTFYRKLGACCPLPLLQAGELLSTVAVQTVVAAAVALVGGVAWGLRLQVSAVSAGAIVVCSLGMYGMGLILDGAAVRYKRVGSLLFLFQLGILFVTDTVSSGAAALGVTRLIPLTACNDLIRLSMTGGDLGGPALHLCALSLAWLVVGYAVFRFLLARAKRDGTLLYY